VGLHDDLVLCSITNRTLVVEEGDIRGVVFKESGAVMYDQYSSSTVAY
jgi:hypothetical protein